MQCTVERRAPVHCRNIKPVDKPIIPVISLKMKNTIPIPAKQISVRRLKKVFDRFIVQLL